MKLTKYTPAGALTPAFRDEFTSLFSPDGLFDQIFGKEFTKNFGIDYADNVAYPRVDVIDAEDKLVLEAEIPGLKKDEISVEVENGVLYIKGEKKMNLHKDANYVIREIKKSAFTRSFTLGDSLEQDKITADFVDGLLTVEIPKRKEVIEKTKKRKIM